MIRKFGALASAVLAAASIVVAVGPGQAADMPVKARPIVVDPGYNWTGFYVGANGGYAWRDSKTVAFVPNDPLIQAVTCGGVLGGTCPTNAFNDLSGGFGGLQAGYNWQFQRWLLGVEADVQAGDIRGQGRNPTTYQLGLS